MRHTETGRIDEDAVGACERSSLAEGDDALADELDAARAVHERELKTERCAKDKLSEKLDRYLDEVRRAEGERDEMREVVAILVEKGVWLFISSSKVSVGSPGNAFPSIRARTCSATRIGEQHASST